MASQVNLISAKLLARILRMLRWFESQPMARVRRRRTIDLSSNDFLGYLASGAINKGSSGTVTIYSGTPGSESSTGTTVTAFNKFGNVANNKYVWLRNNGFGWYLIAAEC